jgi:hypothetical protein
MTLRTTKSSVTFGKPFKLKGMDEEQPAGTYEVETDEEVIESHGRTVYVRVATLLLIRSPGMTRTVTVDPNELNAAQERDRDPRR